MAALTPDPAARWVGEEVGGYRLLSLIDEGAMAWVFEGVDESSGAKAAVKILRGGANADPVASQRLVREHDTARTLAHRHIVEVREGGRMADGSWYIAMERLEGETLKHALIGGRGLSPARMLRVASQLALALGHAHGRGVVHRDLKPANIFLCRDAEGDDVRVLDWGSVKRRDEAGAALTAAGTTLGSPSYMSTEQASGEDDLDGRSDVFSLSVLLFEMATGAVPFTGQGVAEILSRVVNAEAPSPSSLESSLPPGLDQVLARGLAKDPAERYPGAMELVGDTLRAFGLAPDIERWAGEPTAAIESALTTARPPRARGARRFSPRAWLVAALALFALVAVTLATCSL